MKDVEDHTDEELVTLKANTEENLARLYKRKGVQEEKYRLQELLRDIEDEQSYRQRCKDKGEPYIPPAPLEEAPPPKVESPAPGLARFNASVAGKVYNDCVSELCSDFLKERPDIAKSKQTYARGRGISVVFEDLTRDQVMELIIHLDYYTYSRLSGSDSPEDKEIGYQIRENAQRLKKMVGLDPNMDTTAVGFDQSTLFSKEWLEEKGA